MQPLRLGNTGVEFDAKTPCFSGDSQDVVLPVVLRLLESPAFCELVALWQGLDDDQRRNVLHSAHQLAKAQDNALR